MDSASDLSYFSALDVALLGSFFISYSVLALVQINNLFNRRFIQFAALAAATALITKGFAIYDFIEFCADGPSAIVCGGKGQGLVWFSLPWVYVSGAMLALYGIAQGIRVLRSR